MASLMIRPAEERDLDDIVRILNHYIQTSHVTFDTEPFDSGSRRSWFDQFHTDGRHRLLIAEDGPAIVGYAASTALRPKPAYLPSVETSIYLDPDHTGRGIGIRLYRTLLDALRRADVHRAYAGIALPNPGSVALHEALGFQHVGTFDEAGRKFDRYWSIGWWERRFS